MKSPTIKDRKKLKDKLWKLISEYVRREANGICYTCNARVWNEQLGENDWKSMNAGHFCHGVLDDDLRNLKCQCVRCNHWLSGNLQEYTIRLIKDYGMEWVEKLRNDAKLALKGELHDAEYYQTKIREIEEKLQGLNS